MLREMLRQRDVQRGLHVPEQEGGDQLLRGQLREERGLPALQAEEERPAHLHGAGPPRRTVGGLGRRPRL